jgi:hypothetical protein
MRLSPGERRDFCTSSGDQTDSPKTHRRCSAGDEFLKGHDSATFLAMVGLSDNARSHGKLENAVRF